MSSELRQTTDRYWLCFVPFPLVIVSHIVMSSQKTFFLDLKKVSNIKVILSTNASLEEPNRILKITLL